MSTLRIGPVSPVAVVGAGLMGSQIAAEYALGGRPVTLQDLDDDAASRGLVRAVEALENLVRLGVVSREAAAAAGGRLRATSALADACRDAALVVESVIEDVGVKTSVIRAIAASAPRAVIATNTSSCPIALLGERAGAAERLIGTHYWNPPLLMSLVEVVPGPHTEPDVTAEVVSVLTAMRKDPVVVPDIPGFVWNRLQFALLREAVALVSQHGVPPATIDAIMRRGLGRRWSIVGPFESMALGGPATFRAVSAFLFPQLATDVDHRDLEGITLPSPAELSRALGERDVALARLLLQDRASSSPA